jgi:hypothetical protein
LVKGYVFQEERRYAYSYTYRDWVIRAFSRNQPFDQFVREQLSGDLMPKAAREQVIATGFVRNNMINFEGGAIAEEYLNAYMVDRVNTFSTVFLGLTMNCAQCHDHKYDPLTMRDFYSLYAYFNAVPERGLDGNRGNAEPVLSVPTAEQEARIAELEAEIKAAESAGGADGGPAVGAVELRGPGRMLERAHHVAQVAVEDGVHPVSVADRERGARRTGPLLRCDDRNSEGNSGY